jgi:hypothetical protein
VDNERYTIHFMLALGAALGIPLAVEKWLTIFVATYVVVMFGECDPDALRVQALQLPHLCHMWALPLLMPHGHRFPHQAMKSLRFLQALIVCVCRWQLVLLSSTRQSRSSLLASSCVIFCPCSPALGCHFRPLPRSCLSWYTQVCLCCPCGVDRYVALPVGPFVSTPRLCIRFFLPLCRAGVPSCWV